MTLTAFKFPPGVVRLGTDGMQRGRWWNANLIRWRNGSLVPVGGWDRLTTAPMATPARKMLAWRSNLDVRYVAIGTDTQLLILDGAQLLDKTPGGFAPLPSGSALQGGYGTGPYNYSTYDTPRDGSAFTPAGNPYGQTAIWTIDTWGEDIVAVASSDGRLLHLSPNSNLGLPTWDLQANVVNDAPINNRGTIVTEERFVMLFGAGGNPRAVAWCSREDLFDWDFANVNNTAGFIELDCQGTFMNAVKVRGGILLWTEAECWIGRYVGLPAIYGFERVGKACGLLAANAFATIGGAAIWPGLNAFWTYSNGAVQPLPCDVADFLYRRTDIKVLADRMTGGSNGRFPEAWFFFPEMGQYENNAYIATNPNEGWWTIGHLSRTALEGAGVWPFPLMSGVDGHLYQHENGWLDAGASRGASVFVESGAQQIPPAGGQCINILGGQLDSGSGYDATQMRAFTRETHDDPIEWEEGPFQAYSDGWIECRFSGRDIRVRIEQILDQPWAVGEMRFDVIPGRGR